jgi:hypothetical protein
MHRPRFEDYGRELIKAGIYPMCFNAEWNNDKLARVYYRKGWNQIESYGELKNFTPNPDWNTTDSSAKNRVLAVNLKFSKLICFDIDVKKCTQQIEGMSRDQRIDFAQSLVPKPWLESGCYIESTKSGGLHLIWKCPEELTGLPERGTVLASVYQTIKEEYDLNNLIRYGKKYPDCYEFKTIKITISPTYGYDPIGEIKSLSKLDALPPQEFIDAAKYNATKQEQRPVTKITPVHRQRYYSSSQSPLETLRDELEWQSLFMQCGKYESAQTIRKGNSKFDCLCSSPFTSDSTPSFYFQSAGQKKFHCFSTQRSGDIIDIYNEFIKG